MSAFRRGNRWVAKFQLRGEQHWIPGGPWETKSAAREAERRYRERIEHRRTDESCASFAKRWLEEWPRSAASTRRNYEEAARQFAEHFGPTPLGEVGRLSARTWSLTVPRYVSRTIGTMYEDARNVGLIEQNPFTNLRLPVTARAEQIQPPSLDEFRRLVASCTVLGGYGAEFRSLIQFAAWTGVRAGELQGLQWEDLDGELIHVRRSRKRDGSYGVPKSGKSRTIVFLPPARVLDDVPRRPDPFIFHAPRGGTLDQGSMFYAWREVRSNADLRRVRFHDLRHFAATQLLELGLSHFDVSVQLGHEDGGALVMARYGHPSKVAARERLLAVFELSEPPIGSQIGSETGTDGS